MAEEIRTYFKIIGPDGYYLTDYVGDDLEFDDEREAEDYILDVFDGDFDSYTIEEYSNTDKVTSERWGQEPEEEKTEESLHESVDDDTYDNLVDGSGYPELLDFYDIGSDKAAEIFEKVYEELDYPQDDEWIIHPDVLRDGDKMQKLHDELRKEVVKALSEDEYAFDTAYDKHYGEHEGTEKVIDIFGINKKTTFESLEDDEFDKQVRDMLIDGGYFNDEDIESLKFIGNDDSGYFEIKTKDGKTHNYDYVGLGRFDYHDENRFKESLEEVKESKLDDGEYIDSLAIEGKWTCVYTSGDNREIPFEEEDYLTKTFDTEEEATAFAEEKIKETSDVYGHNFVSVFDPEGDEILTLNSYDDNFNPSLREYLSEDKLIKFQEHPFFKEFALNAIRKFIEIYCDFVKCKEEEATPEDVYNFMSEEGLGIFALDNMDQLRRLTFKQVAKRDPKFIEACKKYYPEAFEDDDDKALDHIFKGFDWRDLEEIVDDIKSIYFSLDESIEGEEDEFEEKEIFTPELDEEVPETHEEQMDFLAKDEDEAIEGYEKVIEKTDNEHLADQLKHIKEEEVAHKEFLEIAKEDPEATYEHEEHEEESSEPVEEELIYGLYINDDEKPAEVGSKKDMDEKKKHLEQVSPEDSYHRPNKYIVRKIGYTSWESLEKGLNESIVVNLYDDDEIKEAKEELEKDEEQPTEEIIDVNANIESELQDSYVGDCILQCCACKGLRYIKPEDLVKSEDVDEKGRSIYNIEDECPTCHANDGWLLGGQVAKMSDEPVEEETSEEEFTDEEIPEDDEFSEPVIPGEEEEEFEEADEESFKEAINEYLVNTYTNVENYELNNMTYDGSKLILEGVVNYKSGLSATSNFELNVSYDEEKVILEGNNTLLTDDSKAFKFLCENVDKKLINKELEYNYTYKDVEIAGKVSE